MSETFVSSREFARLVGISERKARRALGRCAEGGTWRGVQLQVVTVHGKGGRGGATYRVALNNQLPGNADVHKAKAQSSALDWRPTGSTSDPLQWKLAVIQHIIRGTEVGSPTRAAAIRAAAETVRYEHGSRRGAYVKERTLRAWIAEYEGGGVLALTRKCRADTGKRRVIISGQWDALASVAGLSEAQQQQILNRVENAIQSEFKAGNSWQVVQLNVMPVLARCSQEAGMELPPGQLAAVCKPPRSLIDRQRRFGAAAIYRKDAGRSAAIQWPRVKRDRSGLRPMECVAGDVHHIDIAFRRADGSLCTVKAIAWMDLATNRVFMTPVLVAPGCAVRRADVLQSFAAMCADPNWGVPTRLYLDNGSEYALLDEMSNDLLALKQFATVDVRDARDLEPGVTKSRPYNPQSKVIETLFSILERCAFPQLPGHMGGNRMKKKTENQGKAPVPFDGDFKKFCTDLSGSIDWHHRKPQSGHLSGKTPNERFQTFIDAGWQSVTLDPHQLEVAFSVVKTRQVKPGGVFTIGGRAYRHDALLHFAGTGQVTVRVPLIGDGSRVYVFDDEGRRPLCIATDQEVFDFGDPAGAVEQGRQMGVFKRQMAEFGDVPRDGRASMAAVVAMTPEPRATSSGMISINNDFQEAARMAGAPPDRLPRDDERQARAEVSRTLAQLAGTKRVAGG